MKKKSIILAAGGTGGHINAALAIGEYYQNKGYDVLYITGKRYLDYQLYKNTNAIHLPTLGLRYKNPFKILKSLFVNFYSLFLVAWIIIKNKPMFILGTGGYVCGPVVLIGKIFLKPTFILEQNAVLGLTNKILSHLVNRIFINLEQTKGLSESVAHKTVVVGNPIRFSYQENSISKNLDTINILVFGGSLGATQINDSLELALNKIDDEKVHVVHQSGKNNAPLKITSKVNFAHYDYIDDMAKYYAWADKIICRAGASSVSELKAVGKPVLLVPFPGATDDHQTLNAQALKNEVDFDVIICPISISKEELANQIYTFINNKSLRSGTAQVNKALERIDQAISSLI